jgi:hypothetical protein
MADTKLLAAKAISAFPWLVLATSIDVTTFLATLPAPDFETAANPTQDWAVQADQFYPAGIEAPGSAWVVSAGTYRRLKAHRF